MAGGVGPKYPSLPPHFPPVVALLYLPPSAPNCTAPLRVASHFTQMRFSIWLGPGPKCLRIKFAWKSVYIDREWPMQMFAGQMNGQSYTGAYTRTVDIGAMATSSSGLTEIGHCTRPTSDIVHRSIAICLRQCSLGIFNTRLRFDCRCRLRLRLRLHLPNVISRAREIIVITL